MNPQRRMISTLIDPAFHHRPALESQSDSSQTSLVRERCLIDKPMYFIQGRFIGKTVRAELHELQKPDLGQKYTRADRRPLDPPCVILLKLFYTYSIGNHRVIEEEIPNYDQIATEGLLCSADLFPASNSDARVRWTWHHSASQSSAPTEPATSGPWRPGPSTVPLQPRFPNYPHSDPSASATDIALHTGVKKSLVGSTVVEPCCIDYQGKKVLVFVFSVRVAFNAPLTTTGRRDDIHFSQDLAVKAEGFFFLRFRVFDILSKISGATDSPVQAQCYSGVFRVYSAKEFPGLPKSTELTKHRTYLSRILEGGVFASVFATPSADVSIEGNAED